MVKDSEWKYSEYAADPMCQHSILHPGCALVTRPTKSLTLTGLHLLPLSNPLPTVGRHSIYTHFSRLASTPRQDWSHQSQTTLRPTYQESRTSHPAYARTNGTASCETIIAHAYMTRTLL